ncbi:hypothetical protein BXZ70DRAFT_1003367 [Cristinia sonorae]|uniref:Secreted protein n=1 Tax=Cristinia sonorae TaxID=1940300 RepID=A0A8K0V0B4_9AGAR|nr:hypothetical protein BXZ70DRAFT_1003367 [Cristinia sonorae]
MAIWPLVSTALQLSSALLSLPILVNGQAANATCPPEFGWMSNVRNQDACLIGAYVAGACEIDRDWTVVPISRPNTTYKCPSKAQANICTCSSVTYTMMMACSYCQQGRVRPWSEWVGNCTAEQATNGKYLHGVPAGTDIPTWSYLEIEGDYWDPVRAQAFASPPPIIDGQPSNDTTESSTSSTESTSATSSSASTSIPITSSSLPTISQPSAVSSAHQAQRELGALSVGALMGGLALALTFI